MTKICKSSIYYPQLFLLNVEHYDYILNEKQQDCLRTTRRQLIDIVVFTGLDYSEFENSSHDSSLSSDWTSECDSIDKHNDRQEELKGDQIDKHEQNVWKIFLLEFFNKTEFPNANFITD